MYCQLNDLRNKCVINIRNGSQLGFAYDVQIDTSSALISALVLKGKLRLWGLLGREEDTVVKWSDIEVIGEDTILVNHTVADAIPTPKGKLFHILTEEEEA